MDQIRRGNYDSGQDYVLEYGELRFTFNERDFSERVEQAARKLGFVGNPLEDTELEDLVNLTVNGEVVDPASGLGEHVNDCWPDLVGPADRSLVHWLRRLVFRSAWLDQRVKEGELDVVFDEITHTFGYVQPERDREPIELSPEPTLAPRRLRPAPLLSDARRRRHEPPAPRRSLASRRRASWRPACACAAGFFAAAAGFLAAAGFFAAGAASSPPPASSPPRPASSPPPRASSWPPRASSPPRPASWPPPRASPSPRAGFFAAGRAASARGLRAAGFGAARARPPASRARLAGAARRLGRPAPGRARPATGAAPRRAGSRLGAGAGAPDEQLRAQRAGLAQRERRERARRGQRAIQRDDRRLAADRRRRRWRSRSASRAPARLRPAASARRAAAAGRYSKPSISTTASPPRAATRRPTSTACSTACACASTDAENVQRRARRDREVGDLLRAHAGQHRADLEPARRRPARPRAAAAPRSCPSATGRRSRRASPCRTASATRSP